MAPRGGRQEDEGTWFDVLQRRGRLTRHFHDPLRIWDTAGLQHPVLGPFEASVRWMQRANQGNQAVGGDWSWQDARRHYLDALTRPTREDQGTQEGRDKAFADTFR